MVRTLHDALELLDAKRVLTEVPASGVTSLVEAVAGGPVEGSWREHAKGKLMYRLGRMLRASPDVLTLRLIEGKTTFVERSLWPAVYRVVMDSTRRRAALAGLSEEARAVLTRIERDRTVRTDAVEVPEKAREALEERLLVHVLEFESAPHVHALELASWKHWASTALRETAEAMTYEEALAQLKSECGHSCYFGPWVG